MDKIHSYYIYNNSYIPHKCHMTQFRYQSTFGYQVQFDDHHGVAEMLIDINTIGIMRWEDGKEPGVADWAIDGVKHDEIEEGI